MNVLQGKLYHWTFSWPNLLTLACFLGDMLNIKSTSLQGSTLSGHCMMTTGFGPFELPTRGLLQKGRNHSPPKVCFEKPSFWLAHSAMGIHSAVYIQITKQIGGGAQWVELS